MFTCLLFPQWDPVSRMQPWESNVLSGLSGLNPIKGPVWTSEIRWVGLEICSCGYPRQAHMCLLAYYTCCPPIWSCHLFPGLFLPSTYGASLQTVKKKNGRTIMGSLKVRTPINQDWTSNLIVVSAPSGMYPLTGQTRISWGHSREALSSWVGSLV